MFELIACDMAGTTIDEHADVYRALENAVRDFGVEVKEEDLQQWMGAEKKEAIKALIELGGGSASDEQVQAQFVRFRELLLGYYQENPPVALPGVVEALQHLAASGTRIALTTGFSRDVADIILDGLGWKVGPGELLDAVVAGDETAAGRPAPYMIHRAMELTGIRDVAKVVAAGDTANDLLAAHHAGVHGIGVLTGKLGREDLERYPHAAILESVAGLPEYLASIESEAA
ncbi:phosphonatase-like hydrolase [Glutamicibacter mysorens]|uniref:Phosphonatase-like hydrolase n=1 Tax=Glutamicibacter mysorens TaxID=257984 RepID=A0ABX4MVD7_9MICC|nr:phosphonatase-like hydrolase [Glutamicibacter mysorens]PJJ43282.1 phosphonatase-like hydrolase [Glutamicibacter mysorens]